MKWSVLVCLATPIAILVGSGIAAIVPSVADSLNNGGAHGFSELLYAYSSCGGNNGSAFAGFNANTVFFEYFPWTCNAVCPFPAYYRNAGDCRKPCRKEKDCNHSWYTFYYKCNVCILADFYCFACWCAQLFPQHWR